METLETIQTRHRKEQRDLQSRITNKKKNATKKSRKGINDECMVLEQDLKERQERELAAWNGDGDAGNQRVEESQAEEPNGLKQNAAEESVESRDVSAAETDAVTDRLKTTTISADEPQPQERGGKKRNRQKERMARRTAEREAASEAAEQEVQNMTDHRGLERLSLERTFNTHGLVEHEIRPDGHCLFSAVADQLAQREISIAPPSISDGAMGGEVGEEKGAPYRVVRGVATDYMESHADDFAPFLEEPLESYVPKIRDTAEWGGQLELLALASAYQIEIKVVQNGRTETIRPSGGEVGKDGDRTIWLAYYRHGYGLGEHYNSLRKKV